MAAEYERRNACKLQLLQTELLVWKGSSGELFLGQLVFICFSVVATLQRVLQSCLPCPASTLEVSLPEYAWLYQLCKAHFCFTSSDMRPSALSLSTDPLFLSSVNLCLLMWRLGEYRLCDDYCLPEVSFFSNSTRHS